MSSRFFGIFSINDFHESLLSKICDNWTMCEMDKLRSSIFRVTGIILILFAHFYTHALSAIYSMFFFYSSLSSLVAVVALAVASTVVVAVLSLLFCYFDACEIRDFSLFSFDAVACFFYTVVVDI